MKHEKLDAQIHSLQCVLNQLDGLLERIKPSEVVDSEHAKVAEKTDAALYHVLSSSPSRIADFIQQAQDKIASIEAILFDDE